MQSAGRCSSSKPFGAMLSRLGWFSSAVRRCCGLRHVRSPENRTFRSASSAFVRRSSCSFPVIATSRSTATASRRFSAKAVASAARHICNGATVVGACSRGRHQRAVSRRRPGCRASRQSADGSGSSHWVVPARTTAVIASTCPSCHSLRSPPNTVRQFRQLSFGHLGQPRSERSGHAPFFRTRPPVVRSPLDFGP